MNAVFRFLICFIIGYLLIMIMSITAPKILLLRIGLLFILMMGSVLSFYFWEKPQQLWKVSLRISLILAPAAELLSLVHHGLITHDLSIYSATLPFLFALIIPYTAAGFYTMISKIKSPKIRPEEN